ncbi:MAG: MarR family transcriptional regulator [Candidatus Woesearchaeota archaeon]|jgi:uncharacterized membrane protein|nr:MarR family transcriptional regulator [Candidatus Woesearchaeota archaeon]MDP7622583.1 MarR family transcriptional regulator [Candidatus Woesearchaeota archaeon]HJN57295.1 MarR family transcriptional regulator [Candidatus Woesearchaeota archaeon]|tara:strand:+ start:1169 stop:1684 length:516 start_codon:yes stop_codon:yes gene_type:complete
METKKLGFLILGISVMLSLVMFSFISSLGAQGNAMNCNPTQECQQLNSVLGISHIAVGFLAFIFALGFYLLFFNKDQGDVLKRYYDEKLEKNVENKNNDKFSLLLRPLDENERKVLTAIKEQDGITQSTLKYRADLSKAKISQILTDFERKNLIARKAKGKTYSVFLTNNF